MTKKPLNIKPQTWYIIILLIQFIILVIRLVPVFNTMVFLFFLLLIFFIVLRWRLKLYTKYLFIDIMVFIIISFFYPNSIYITIILVFYLSYKYKILYTFPIIFTAIILNSNYNFYILFIQAFMFGFLLYYYEEENIYKEYKNDYLRNRIYNLESIQTKLLSDYKDTEKLSRLTERQKIAEILHDNLGHELTASHLSLKASKTLFISNQNKKALESLNKAELRLQNALNQLKESVKSIEPNYKLGINNLHEILKDYIYPINLQHHGDILKLKPYIWQLIVISVKESLTNITKHASPSKIDISLNVTDFIVKLEIENDGFNKNNAEAKGHGLRYMRNRLEAINGSLSVQIQDTFKLIIIIPIN